MLHLTHVCQLSLRSSKRQLNNIVETKFQNINNLPQEIPNVSSSNPSYVNCEQRGVTKSTSEKKTWKFKIHVLKTKLFG